MSVKLVLAWVQDSGDDWSPSSSEPESDGDATDVIYEVEYEIASESSSNIEGQESDGSSDIEVSYKKSYSRLHWLRCLIFIYIF